MSATTVPLYIRELVFWQNQQEVIGYDVVVNDTSHLAVDLLWDGGAEIERTRTAAVEALEAELTARGVDRSTLKALPVPDGARTVEQAMGRQP